MSEEWIRVNEDDYLPYMSAHDEAVAVIRLSAARFAAEQLPPLGGVRDIYLNHMAVVEAMIRIADEAKPRPRKSTYGDTNGGKA